MKMTVSLISLTFNYYTNYELDELQICLTDELSILIQTFDKTDKCERFSEH